jgi:glycosyl-4,4'-diaponeurosporenoate acyltransferase
VIHFNSAILRLIAINSIAWLVVHLSIAAIFVRIPSRFFSSGSRRDRVSPREMALYRRWFLIRRWKHLLPDGAAWVGKPLSRKRLASDDQAILREILTETNRSEAAHWLMLAFCPVFFLWNPPIAWPILAAYAAAANFPCIAAQRYNRQIVERTLWRAQRLVGREGSHK